MNLPLPWGVVTIMNIATRLQIGQPRNCGSNPGMTKRFFCFPKCLDHLWDLPSFSSVGTGEYSPNSREAGAWSCQLISI